MPVYSAVQTLPFHILEEILEYASTDHPNPLSWKKQPTRPTKQTELLPFMRVCQGWRAVAGSRFYHSALLKLKQLDTYPFNKKELLTMDEVQEIGTQSMVKDLYMHVYAPNFCENWDPADTTGSSAADGDESVNIQNLATMISDCGKLPSVRSLQFILASAKYVHVGSKSDKKEDHDTDNILKNMQTFAKCLGQYAPNIWRTHMILYFYDTQRMAVIHEQDFMLENLGKLVGANVGHLSLAQFKISKQMVADISANSLRSISIGYHKGTQKHIELVRQNAGSLESLRVDHITTHSVLKMTWPKSGGYHTQIYPQLKHLEISGCVGQRMLSFRQPQVDPFPRLQTLICRGYFPFSSPIVLKEGRAHIRHLDIDLDPVLLQMYSDHNVFDKGSFHNLQFISFGWAERGVASRRQAAGQMFTMTTELCANAQVMRIDSSRMDGITNSFDGIHLAKNLRVLDMKNNMLNIDEMISLLCGFSRLEKANIALKDAEPRSLRMPDIAVLEEYQKRYKSHSTSAWALGIHNVYFGNSRRASEYIVLLVDILSSIRRVSIHHNCTRSPTKLLYAIKFVKRRKAYNDRLIQNVEFTDSRHW